MVKYGRHLLTLQRPLKRIHVVIGLLGRPGPIHISGMYTVCMYFFGLAPMTVLHLDVALSFPLLILTQGMLYEGQ